MTADTRSTVPSEHGDATLLVMPEEQGLRLDQFLATATTLSRRAVRRLIADGAVRRNGQSARVQSRTVAFGDVVVLAARDLEAAPTRATAPVLPTLLLEDRWLLAADKPSGILSQPADPSRGTDLAFDQIVLLGLAAREGRRPYLRLVHRLDRLTSGIVLFGRAARAMPPLTEAWRSGRVDRRYIAVVEGHPDFDVHDLDHPIDRDPSHGWRFIARHGGRPAHTRFQVLDRHPAGFAVVECRPITGRTHQIRVHLAELGHPVAGDRLYGGRRFAGATRPLLHAAMLSFPHPGSGRPQVVVCRPPVEFDSYLTPRVVARLGELEANTGSTG